MKIVLPEYIEILSDKHINELKELGVNFYKDFPKTDEEIIKRIGDAEVAAIKWIKLPKNILHACHHLKYIIVLSVGINFVDYNEAKELGIKVINCPTHNSHAVAEHVFVLIFSLLRQVCKAQVIIRRALWKKTPYSFMGEEIAGKKLFLIGYGRIGRRVGQIAKALNMTVDFANSKTKSEALDNLIRKADIISLNLPYNETTHHLIDKRKLKIMKKTAYIINTSRGEIINQKELYNALKHKEIAGAGLDCFEDEPINTNPSAEIVDLVNLLNVVATPHIGFNTKESAFRLGEEFIKNVKGVLKEKPINVVD